MEPEYPPPPKCPTPPPRYKVMVKKEETPPRLPSPCLLGQEPESPRQSFCGVKTESGSSAPTGNIKLERVDFNHEGRLATVAEVRANFNQLQGGLSILMPFTIALLDGGKVSGVGHELTKSSDGKKWLPTVEEGDFTHEAGKVLGEIQMYSTKIIFQLEKIIAIEI